MRDLGTVRPGSTIRIPFSSFDKDDGSSVTMTNYAAADLLVYKDGGTTERASTAGFTATTDFDSKTGKHLAILDLADNTTAGFWNAGSEYLVAVDAVTVDGVTTGGWIARFRIGYPGSLFDTTLASLTNQTSFTLTVGPAEDDALNGCQVILHDIASAVQFAKATVLDYTGSTKTVTLAAAPSFTIASGDNISIMSPSTSQIDMTNSLATLLSILGLTSAHFSHTDTAQGGDATHITLATGAVASDDYYNYQLVHLTGATGAGQTRFITDYVGSTRVATVDRAWVINPDNTTGYATIAFSQVPGASAPTAAENADAVWDELTSAHAISGSFGKAVSDTLALSGGITTLITMLTGAVPINGTLGATGNSTTTLHLAGLGWADDGPNDMLILVKDVSAGLFVSRWITDWADTGDLATVAALPFLPQASVDQYWILSPRRDVTGGSGLDAAGVRAAIGMASANLDTQLTAIDDAVDTETAAILAKVNNLPTDPADQSLVEAAITAAFTTVLPNSIAADGSRPTVNQALLFLTRFLAERGVVGTTMTVNDEVGTPVATFTLNNATSPTAITRAT